MVELIVVIVILGILAAVALPKFMGLEQEARIAALKSMGGTMNSAAQMAHGMCMARNCPNGGAGIVIAGATIIFANGYPDNASIDLLVQSYEGFTPNAAGNQMTKLGGATVNCWVQYNAPVVAGLAPTISYNAGTITSAATEITVNTALRVAC
jgi:MSHA pilin protein MshA